MIQLTDDIWIGSAGDEERADLNSVGISAVLNVAQDLQGTRGWRDGIEYMQVGLIDGPGNPLSTYHAAVLALVALLTRCRTLVCCHHGAGGRSLAVVLMYLHLVGKRGWDNQLEILRGRTGLDLVEPANVHREAFNKLQWRLLAAAKEN